MPATAPDTIIAEQLVSVLGSPWALGTNLFTGPVRPAQNAIPHQAIFCLDTGGPAPLPYLGGSSAPNYSRPHVQVRVRSVPGDFAGGLDLARNVAAALNKASLTGYAACLLQQSTPNYLGMDAADHHEWSVNVELWLVQ